MKGGSIEDLTAIVQDLSLELNTLYKDLEKYNNPQSKAKIRVKILETSQQLKSLSEALVVLKTDNKKYLSSKPIDDNLQSKSSSISSKLSRSLSFSKRSTKARGKTKLKKLKKLRKKTNKKRKTRGKR